MLEYNILTDEWKETDTPMTQKRYYHSCSMIDEYELMVVGGCGGSCLKSSEIFNLKERKWKRGPDVQKGILRSQLVKAQPGFEYLAYMIGGRNSFLDDSSEIFGLTKDKKEFKKIGDLKKARRDHVAFVLPESISDRCGH